MLARPEARHSPLATPHQILRFLNEAAQDGLPGALVVVTDRSGGPRAAGAIMAVLENGDTAGSLSSGCAEAAIVAEALDTIRSGQSRKVRFGQGSRYIDIRLPCGAAMDLLFLPDPAHDAIERAVALLGARMPVQLIFGRSSVLRAIPVDQVTPHWANDGFRCRHVPDLRVIVAGAGAECRSMLLQARAYGAEVALLSPDEQVAAAAAGQGVRGVRLLVRTDVSAMAADPWTAIVLLFHDSDWETPLLEQALATEAFWIGAMGSAHAHESRLAALIERGAQREALTRIRGPIGTINSARDPATLALSAFAEIVQFYQARRQ